MLLILGSGLTVFELSIQFSAMNAIWAVSFPLLGLACLRGWSAVRWPWLALHGLGIFSFIWTSIQRPQGESLWFGTALYALTYTLVAWVLVSPRARAFFRSPAGSAA
jgi:hypothetical protein